MSWREAMHQQQVPMNQPFETPMGPHWTPPLCDECCCTMGLAFDP
jgi:hypothetical protein